MNAYKTPDECAIRLIVFHQILIKCINTSEPSFKFAKMIKRIAVFCSKMRLVINFPILESNFLGMNNEISFLIQFCKLPLTSKLNLNNMFQQNHQFSQFHQDYLWLSYEY